MLDEHPEEQLGTGLGPGYEAQFIDDQQLIAGDLLLAICFWKRSSFSSSQALISSPTKAAVVVKCTR